jgi:DNA-binding SARP family transcriptional activator
MTSSFSGEHNMPASIAGTSSLAFFLERGFDYVQRGYYVEGAAFLVLAREQLSPNQLELADILDTFIHKHTGYQRAQRALQEVTAHFAEAYAELQAQAVNFATALPALTRSLGLLHHFPCLRTDANYQQKLQPPDPTSQYLQEPSQQPHNKDSSPLPELSITCFGRFEVRQAGIPVVLCSSRNGQSILRYLVARPRHYATSDTLQAIFWPEDEPEVAQRKLHIAISVLRRSLDNGSPCGSKCSYIVCKNRVYSLNPAVIVRTDVDDFLHYYQAGQQVGEGRIALYEKACCLYTGPFLVEDMYADWSFIQREQLNRLYLAMCRILADHHFKVECYEDAMKWAIAILKENRCDESTHRLLIQIYAAQGQRSEALQQYHRCECLLREELGVQPMPETQAIFQTILGSEPPLRNNKAKT